MNNKGQLILYDLLLALIIIILVVMASTIILEENSQDIMDIDRQQDASNMMELLENTRQPGLLYSLSTAQNTNNTIEEERIVSEIEMILSDNNRNYDYRLIDITTDKIIVDKEPKNYKKVYSSHKTVNKHTYVLKIYQ